MEDRETNRRYSDDANNGYDLATPPYELIDATELAGQLEGLLAQESEILRRFENRKLLKILHLKESLIGELAAKLSDLTEAKNGRMDMDQLCQYTSLKTCLREIDKLNRSNQAFIEGALSHYQDFMDCVCPGSYHPRYVNESRREMATFKGRTFRKEM